jgi:hypothetical protein
MKKRLRKSAVKPVVKPKIPSRSRILESLTGSDALSILKILADRDERLAREIVADAWENIYHGKPPLSKLESFVKEHCPDYAEWFARHLRFRTR